MTTCLTSLGEGIASGMRMLAMALANPPCKPSPVMAYAQPNYPPQYNSYGRFNTSLPMTHEASYENRDAFPASISNVLQVVKKVGALALVQQAQFYRPVKPCMKVTIMAVIIFKVAINELLFFQF